MQQTCVHKPNHRSMIWDRGIWWPVITGKRCPRWCHDGSCTSGSGALDGSVLHSNPSGVTNLTLPSPQTSTAVLVCSNTCNVFEYRKYRVWTTKTKPTKPETHNNNMPKFFIYTIPFSRVMQNAGQPT